LNRSNQWNQISIKDPYIFGNLQRLAVFNDRARSTAEPEGEFRHHGLFFNAQNEQNSLAGKIIAIALKFE
jgi:hypothetical protein